MILYHVTHYVTTVVYLLSPIKLKIKIKSRKIDKIKIKIKYKGLIIL